MWNSLHTHSQFSILDSTCSVDKIAEKAKEHKMSAVALTDHGNLFGAIDFYKACLSQNIQPIIGCELWVAPTSRLEKKRLYGMPIGYPLVLLAKNQVGYRNLCKLSSIGYLEGFYYYPRIDKETLQAHAEGLICLSGSSGAHIPSLIAQGKDEQAEILWYQKLFGSDYYFELLYHPMEEELIEKDGMKKESWVHQTYKEYIDRQEKVKNRLKELSPKYGIKCVAANDIHYMQREDWRAHEILINVQSGEPCLIWERDAKGNQLFRIPNPKRKIYPSHELYFKSEKQMQMLFSDFPESLSNTVEIASKCSLELDFQTKHYPVFIPPSLEGKTTTKQQRTKETENYLYELCQKGIPLKYFEERLTTIQKNYPNKDPLEVVKNRLDYEFKIIASKGMCDYLLIVYDFIFWAKKQNIPVGPGRGSAAGSIIAYLIGITDIEPLRFHLFFERFINPERISYPDIDVDICMDRRQEVIDYMTQKYGKDRVAQIITFGKMKAKMAIKDVGRVLSIPLAKVNQIAKLIPEDPNMSLEKALSLDPELARMAEEDEDTKMIFTMALRTEGSIRNTSIHAAGLIVSEDSITKHIPVCIAKDADMVVTQFAMKPVESVGMLKIDFLGLKTLTSIQKAVQSIENNTQKKLNWSHLPLDDKNTFNLLNQGKTLGVFQLESGGMQDLARQLHIDHFEEIIAVGALYRPGPMDMIPTFINRKHGKEKIEIDHPLMKDVLKETYGVMVYQEQVMQIASLLAGYSLGEGDVLRRAMGKKDKVEMARQRKKFITGAQEKNINQDIAVTIFNKIEKFASYGFNKSHAAAYGYLSYVTAFLKANYPKEWMAALMTCDRDDLSKVAKFIREAASMKISILPPDVNEAHTEFTPTSQGIRFAISGIKGVGSAVVDAILEERKKGLFSSLYDFIKRIDKSKVGKKNIELMISAGCFDSMGWSRDAMLQSLTIMFEKILRQQKEQALGVMDFFSLLEEEGAEFNHPPIVKNPSQKKDILSMEKDLLGFYLTGHPMDNHRKILSKLATVPLKDFEKVKEPALIRVGFIAENFQFKISMRSQKKFAILTISDGNERFEVPIWTEMCEKYSNLLEENKILFALLEMGKDRKLQCRYLHDLTLIQEEDLSQIDELYKKHKAQLKSFKKHQIKSASMEKEKKLLHVLIDADQMRLTHILDLKKLFQKYSGSSKIKLSFESHQKTIGSILIDESLGVNGDPNLVHDLKQISQILNASFSISS